MKLKKINEKLREALVENGLTEANDLQKETFSTIKSGADCLVFSAKGSGKTTTIVLNVIQKLAGANEESPRALIFVEDKAKVLEMEVLFEKYGKYANLEVYGVHEKGDMDYDKNYVSTGIDVLIGTPTKLSDMFSTAGYNVNRLKMFIVDDAETLLKLRQDTKIMRISDSIAKVQRLIFSDAYSERVAIFADKILVEPYEFDFEEEEDDDFEEEEGDEENGNN